MISDSPLPIAVIGAGPVGLAAAAHLIARGLEPLVFERGTAVGAAIADWAHVRVFSPWRYNVDLAARALLEANGWTAPAADHLPTGGEILRDYLEPLAALPALAPRLRLGAEVLAISRRDHSRLDSEGRNDAPFMVVWRDASGQHRTLARAVIDASGTSTRPNPIGRDGLPVEGELENADRIAYGIPDVKQAARNIYAGQRTLVIGAGHSAINVVLDLLDLQAEAPQTQVIWATRSGGINRLLGGGLNDQLPGRGHLGLAAETAIRAGRVQLLSPFSARRITARNGGVEVEAAAESQPVTLQVDRIVVATGFRPDLSPLGELRLSLDPAVEAPRALAPLIDPNLHSCGTVPPHGVDELSHPETGFFIVGMKSYGRAPTFLMATGYEQVRSIAAELAGDRVAARQVELVLPETGVCSGLPTVPDAAAGASACCGGPATSAGACCLRDEAAKAAGEVGCGCGAPTGKPREAACC
ncbi:MAG: NAD(P)-binding protein [Rhodobacteraceae bacterium]|nr:NAD(P)-binding protein [Paracoccaceae bacterium]